MIDHPTAVRAAADPRRAHIDGLDQQVTEHPVGVRDAGLGDPLRGIPHDGGRGLPANALLGGPDPLVNRSAATAALEELKDPEAPSCRTEITSRSRSAQL
jgi:hypothetical protein